MKPISRAILIAIALLCMIAPLAEAYSVATGSINLTHVRQDKSGKKRSFGVAQAYGAATDSTFVCGFECQTVSVTAPAAADVYIQFIGDTGELLTDPGAGLWSDETIANPLAGAACTRWGEILLAAGKTLVGPPGMRFIRFRGNGTAGTAYAFGADRK